MSTRQTVVLSNPQQAAQVLPRVWAWCKAMLVAGHRLVLDVRLETRSAAANRLRGHDVEPPVLVGDPSKAGALVLGGGRSRTSYTLVAGTALAAVGRIGGAT